MLSVVENPSQTSKQTWVWSSKAFQQLEQLTSWLRNWVSTCPITQAIYRVIYEGVNIKEAITDIMSNEFKAENEWS